MGEKFLLDCLDWIGSGDLLDTRSAVFFPWMPRNGCPWWGILFADTILALFPWDGIHTVGTPSGDSPWDEKLSVGILVMCLDSKSPNLHRSNSAILKSNLDNHFEQVPINILYPWFCCWILSCFAHFFAQNIGPKAYLLPWVHALALLAWGLYVLTHHCVFTSKVWIYEGYRQFSQVLLACVSRLSQLWCTEFLLLFYSCLKTKVQILKLNWLKVFL